MGNGLGAVSIEYGRERNQMRVDPINYLPVARPGCI